MWIPKAANVVRDTAIAMPEGETESIVGRRHSEEKATGPTYTIRGNAHTSIIHNNNPSIDRTQTLNIRAHIVDNACHDSEI
eukprot:6631991-Karenia_brevis.AAC.1